MSDIVVLINEEIPVQAEVDRLQYGHDDQRYEMQRVQSRQAEHEEGPAGHRSVGNGVAVFPEKDKTADAPEYPDAVFTGFVKWPKQTIERQLIPEEIDRLVGKVGKVLVMPDQHSKGRHETQRL